MVSFSKISRIHFLSVCVFFAVAVLSTSAKQESGIILVQSNATDASSTDCATAKCRRQLKHKRQAPGCDVVVMDDFNSATRFPTRRNLLGGWQDVGGGMAQARSTSGELQLTSTASGAYFFSNFAGTGCYNAGSRSVFRFVATPPSAGATFTLEFQIRNADCTVQIERREYWPVTLGTTGAQTVTINLLDRFTVTELTRLQAIAISGLSILNAPYSFDDFSLACPPTPTPTTSATATATSTSIATSATSLISTGTASPSCTPTPLLIDDFSSASRFASGRNALNFLAGDDGSIATKSIVAGGFSFTVSAGSYWYSDVVARGTCGDISAYSHLELQFSTLPNRNFYVRWRMYDVGGCTVSGSTNYVQVFLETYVPDSSGIIRIPLADFPGLIRTRVLNVGFRAFGTPGSTYVLRRIGLVNLACSPSTVTGSTTLPTATSSSVPTQTPTGTATSVSTTTTTASPTATPILCPGRLVDDFNDATRFSSNVNALNGYFGSGNLVMTRTTDGRLSLVPSSGAYWYSNFNRGACFDATASPYISFTVNAAAGASFSVEMQVRSADCATQIARRVYWSFTTTGTAQNIVLRLDDPDKLTTAELARLQAIVFVAFTPLSILYVFDDIRLNSLGPCSSTTATPSTTTTTSPPTPTGTPVQWPMPPYRIGESYTCGGGTICGNGLCCSSSGFCGETSEYCGSGCQSQCDKNNFLYFPVRDAYESFSSCAYLRDFSLTYDDGPHPTNTPQLLTALANAGVRTTFFVIGENVVSYPGTLLATFQAGHQIASHSFTHPDLTTLTLAQLNDEITRTENAIFNVIGRYPKYFRPPYGAINSQVASVLKSRGYRIILWNYDTKDFETSSSDVVYNGYTGYFGSLDAGRNTWITLQHDIQPSSIGAAVRVLNYLKNTKGYRLKPVWECLGDTSGYK